MQGVLAEVGKAGAGKLYPLLLQLLKENSRLAGGAAGASADAATPLPAQVPARPGDVAPYRVQRSWCRAGASNDIATPLPAQMPCPTLQLAALISSWA